MSRNRKEPPYGAHAEMDDELRTAYRALAEGQPHLPDLSGQVRQTIHKRRVRRLAAAGSTVVVLVPAALIIAFSGGGRSQGDQQVIVSTPGPTATETPSVTATPKPSMTVTPTPAITATPVPSSGSSLATPATTSTPSAVKSQPPGPPQNLPVTATVRQQLIAAYEAGKGLPSSGVKGTRPNSVYYALDPATGIHWAFADFDPSSTLTSQQDVGFQDGGSTGMFRQAPNAVWQFLGSVGSPDRYICGGPIPASVITVWDLSPAGGCSSG